MNAVIGKKSGKLFVKSITKGIDIDLNETNHTHNIIYACNIHSIFPYSFAYLRWQAAIPTCYYLFMYTLLIVSFTVLHRDFLQSVRNSDALKLLEFSWPYLVILPYYEIKIYTLGIISHILRHPPIDFYWQWCLSRLKHSLLIL